MTERKHFTSVNRNIDWAVKLSWFVPCSEASPCLVIFCISRKHRYSNLPHSISLDNLLTWQWRRLSGCFVVRNSLLVRRKQINCSLLGIVPWFYQTIYTCWLWTSSVARDQPFSQTWCCVASTPFKAGNYSCTEARAAVFTCESSHWYCGKKYVFSGEKLGCVGKPILCEW